MHEQENNMQIPCSDEEHDDDDEEEDVVVGHNDDDGDGVFERGRYIFAAGRCYG